MAYQVCTEKGVLLAFFSNKSCAYSLSIPDSGRARGSMIAMASALVSFGPPYAEANAYLPRFWVSLVTLPMREDHPVSRSTDLPQWIFIGVLMSLILLAASLGPAKSTEAGQPSNPPQTSTAQRRDPDAQLTPLQALQRRVEAGDPEAQRLMALRYRDGDGVLRSAEETMRLLGASAQGGDLQSAYELACIYDAGIPGVRSEPKIAWKLFNDAAMAGHVDAMWYLSESYMRGGSEAPYNLIEAYAWRSLAMHIGSQRSAPVYLNWSGPASRGSSGSSVQISSGGRIDDAWLRRIYLPDADILLAQKRSRELLAEIEAKKTKK